MRQGKQRRPSGGHLTQNKANGPIAAADGLNHIVHRRTHYTNPYTKAVLGRASGYDLSFISNNIFTPACATCSSWRDWIGHFDKPTDWPGAVRRSLITLKALINQPTGGMVAALTTSLPEVPRGNANWDYRYCWLRDASFTIESLLNAGYCAEARQWRDWLLRTIAGTPEHIQIMYRIDGARYVDEWTASWLPGYRGASPVRIGNSAARQKQIDVYGELIEAMDMAGRVGIEKGSHGAAVEQAIVERVETVWRTAGHGIWELRSEPRNYVYGKVMAWVAIDRFVRSRSSAGDANCELLARMKALRTQIHEDVCREGFHRGLNSFVQYYGGEDVDASLLRMPIVGFLSVDDPRVAATIARIERELMNDGLVYRNTHSLQDSQGVFLACSCWLADCRRLQGRTNEARAALERMLEVGNDVGLLSEQYDIRGRHLSGNFPQALSHLSLLTTALGLSGPVRRSAQCAGIRSAAAATSWPEVNPSRERHADHRRLASKGDAAASEPFGRPQVRARGGDTRDDR
jgi:GH15 family glucan-1,4-alpha-glucosidase